MVHGSRNAEAKILLDEGSQRSFVTQDLARSLALQPSSQERINISSFGATCPTSRTLDVAIIDLLTRCGETVQLSVLIVPFIAMPLQDTFSVSVTSLPHLCGLQLAHPLTAEGKFEISLLVGADHYWDIVGDHVVRGHGPTAVESKLGYLLSGPMQPVPHSPTANVLMVTNSSCSDFNLERFWTLESVGVSLTDDISKDNMLDHYLTSCLKRADDGAYVARFPWKPTHPRTRWKIAVVNDLVTGGDGLVRAATLRTANGTTNRPITKLYPLELNETEPLADIENQEERSTTPVNLPDSPVGTRPQRMSARKATVRMKEWARVFAAPEDVAETEQ